MNKLINQLQVERDTAFLYQKLAEVQEDPALAGVFRKMAEIEQGHADVVLQKIRTQTPDFAMPGPSRRARLQIRLAKIFGYDFILNSLMATERMVAGASIKHKTSQGKAASGFEHAHLRIVETLSDRSGAGRNAISRLEGRHKTVGGNALRAAVLGANDGLVSNMSLVMGVAGAAAENQTILLTGLAGLLAGAISMALGEWLSVQSSRELFLKQIQLETEELEASPEQEQKELALLYEAKGMSPEDAAKLAASVFENKEKAIDTLVREELGIDQEELGGSAWEAALTSFLLFAVGAIIPVIPFFFVSGMQAVLLSLAGSVVGLFAIGAAITLFTGRHVLFSGFRQVLFGLAAAGVTFGIGRLIGVEIGG